MPPSHSLFPRGLKEGRGGGALELLPPYPPKVRWPVSWLARGVAERGLSSRARPQPVLGTGLWWMETASSGGLGGVSMCLWGPWFLCSTLPDPFIFSSLSRPAQSQAPPGTGCRECSQQNQGWPIWAGLPSTPWLAGSRVDHPVSTGPAGLLLPTRALLQSVPPFLESPPEVQDEVLCA